MPARFDPCPDPLFVAAYNVKYSAKRMKKWEKEYTALKTKEQEDQEEVRVFDIYLWIALVMPTGNWRVWLFSLIPVRDWERRTVCCARKYPCWKRSQVSWPNGWYAAKLVEPIKKKQLSTWNESWRRPGNVTLKILLTCVSSNSVSNTWNKRFDLIYLSHSLYSLFNSFSSLFFLPFVCRDR